MSLSINDFLMIDKLSFSLESDFIFSKILASNMKYGG